MHKLNLIPDEVLKYKAKKKRYLYYALIISTTILLFIYLIVFANNTKIALINEINTVNKEIMELKKVIKTRSRSEMILQDFEKRNKILEEIMENTICYSRIIQEVITFIPEEISLVTLKIDESKKLAIEGYAPSNKSIACIIESVKKLNNLTDVSLGFIRYLDTNDEMIPIYHFEILADIKKD
ncbi:MAG: PilN domain-containing protein [Tepidanaerobacteraceae bacterium]|jgi:Tfp pilus assembly protein PilN|nr:fimbrial assembly protein [Thermoanaerobacterales bacterium]